MLLVFQLCMADIMSANDIREKVEAIFATRDEQLGALDDAAAICDRPLWTDSPESLKEHAKILPYVYDKESVWMVLAYIAPQILKFEADATNARGFRARGLDATRLLERSETGIKLLKTLRGELEEYDKHAKLTVENGTVKRTFIDDYKPPNHIQGLLAVLRQKGTLPSGETFAFLKDCKHPRDHFKEWRKNWEDILTALHPLSESMENSFFSFILSAYVFFLETRLHLAEMTILAHEITSSTQDEAKKEMTKRVLQPKLYCFDTEKAAMEWIDKHKEEIAALMGLIA